MDVHYSPTSLFSNPPRQPRHSPCPSPSSSPPPSFRASDPFRQQTRRLQLRNARFRGAHLSPRKTPSTRLASWGSLSSAGSSDTTAIDQENCPSSSPEREVSYPPVGSARRRVSSILQELHDCSSSPSSPSSQRGRTRSRHPSVSRLFVPSSTASAAVADADEFSLLPTDKERVSTRHSSPASIFQEDDEPDSVAIYRDRGSPLSVKAPPRKNRDQAASYTADRYIDHLETQLAAMQSRLSPMQAAASQSQGSRLRALNAEIKVLRQEILEWEDKFDARVNEEVAVRTEAEHKLKTKIIFLEGQLEENAYRIKELECERDLQAQKLRNVEALRSTNRGLERRVDVLTELLAQSPTRREAPQTPEFSPTRSPGPRLARPRSMLPAVPALPDVMYQPLVVPDQDRDGDAEPEPNHEHPDTPDLIPDDSTMASSSVLSKSQRSSTHSHLSSISSQWSVPLPFSSELQGRTPGRPRNMRRFPSGTCTLKPLILPATAAPTPEPGQRQSQQSDKAPLAFSPPFDPDSPDGSTNSNINSTIITQGKCLAQEETLAALEGRTCYYQTFDEAMLGDDYINNQINNATDATLTRSTRPRTRSRRSDSGDSRYSRLSLYQSYYRPCSSYSAISNSSSAAAEDEFSPLSQTTRRLSLSSNTPVARRRSRLLSERRTSKPLVDKTYPLSKVHEEQPASAASPAGSKNANHHHRDDQSNILHDFKTVFGAMAHRIVVSAWHSSMMRAGKFSWWILSILLGPQRRDEWLKASSLRRARGSQYYQQQQHDYRHPDEEEEEAGVEEELVDRYLKQAQSVDALSPAKGNTIRHTLALWTKFSVTLAVAVALAIRYGPETLLLDEKKTPLGPKKTADAGEDEDEEENIDTIAIDHNNNHAKDGHPEETTTPSNAHPVLWTRPLTIEDFLTG